ncbi:MAG: hypothetical protein M3Y72_06945 [Acidobacteriota bacterium]|nr:hypothetical protein [Acidobacteriota bacterium]
MHNKLLLITVISLSQLSAQQKPNADSVLQQVLQRLDSLEKENRALVDEVHALRQEIAGSQPQTAVAAGTPAQIDQAPLPERVAVNEDRIGEQAQTKVEAAQKFPISLNGMLLFNSFLNSAGAGSYATNYEVLTGPGSAGATLRQSLLGFDMQGPALPGGGQVHASLLMDFGGGSSEPGVNWFRLRRGTVSLDWDNRSFSVGQDKPLISPYAPDSLAEVLVPPLAGAGNLWLWLPQARYEERIHLGESSGLTGQIAVMQTDEKYQTVPDEYASLLQPARPALEGRFAFWHKIDDNRRFEFAPGFHVSTTHVAGYSVSSRLVSFDWNMTPWSKLAITGSAYHGANPAGLGSLGNGFAFLPNGTVRKVQSSGGWTQLSIPLTSRLKFNLFGGIETDNGGGALINPVVRNLTYASNLMYHLGPNVVVSFEALQMRMHLLSGLNENREHYDLAFGYLF